jgi:hypothetical protein
MIEPTLAEISQEIARAPDSTGNRGCERQCQENNSPCFCAEIYSYAALAVQKLYRKVNEPRDCACNLAQNVL